MAPNQLHKNSILIAHSLILMVFQSNRMNPNSYFFLCKIILLFLVLLSLITTYIHFNEVITYETPEFQQEQNFWPISIKRSVDGAFELTLNYEVNSSITTEYGILDSLVLRECSGSSFLLFQDLQNIPLDKWRLPIHPKVYSIYPQAINVQDNIKRLLSHESIEQVPINVPKFRYLITSKKVCHPDDRDSQIYDLIIVVKSGVTNFQKRQELRDMYLSKGNTRIQKGLGIRVGMVFLLGQPCRFKKIHRKNGTFSVCQSKEDFKKTEIVLQNEVNQYDDIISGDFEDNYFNLTLKTQYAFTWVSTFCRRSRPTVLFVDDDVPFSEEVLLKTLYRLPLKEKDNLLHGKLVHGGRVFRFEVNATLKWSLLRSEAPWPKFPTYPYGIYVLVGFSNVEKLTLGMMFTKPFHVDDAWMGLTAIRLGMPFKDIYQLIHKSKILRLRQNGASRVDFQWYY